MASFLGVHHYQPDCTLCDKDGFLATLQDNIATILSHESDTTLANIDK